MFVFLKLVYLWYNVFSMFIQWEKSRFKEKNWEQILLTYFFKYIENDQVWKHNLMT